ncbi:acyl-CoA dehydrogenase family protein [Catellatospora sp. KI3]|uniref:acyl-CoA dehydrogenase family protein n=1 Tax=Catellatospora sp. KI3 TaxID=3041620 RepID=UPI0024828BEC|nr:acyl-CoA dehydrogenase family protein [Catellatospora sp. KI3]MDI1463045.1 acyl-CoA dehydrogenase family protein [Catellatospora sp. KI3]
MPAIPGLDGYRSRWRSADHDALAETVATFFSREVTPREQEFAAQGHTDRELYRRAGALGLLGLSVPEEYGGGGGDFSHETVLFEQQTYSGDASLGLAVHSGIVTGYLTAYGTDEQKRAYLPGLCSGELVGAIAMTEPSGGSDLQSMRTWARADGDDLVVNGAKTFITNGQLADVLLLAVKTDRDQGASGISLIVCDLRDDPPGFRRGRTLHKIGLQANDTAELFFDDYRIPGSAILGGLPGLGFVQMMQQLPQERLVIAVGAVAAMERALELTVAYTKERTAFGKPVYAQQNTRFTLAECAALVRTGRIFLDDCVQRHLDGELDLPTAAMAKFHLTESQCTVIDRCLQLFGGYGYMTEYPIARMYADARAQKIYGGTNEIMKELLARAL